MQAIKIQARSKAASGVGVPDVPSTATRPAMPTTAPIWRKQLETAVPVANLVSGRSATEALVNPANVNPTALPERSCAGGQ